VVGDFNVVHCDAGIYNPKRLLVSASQLNPGTTAGERQNAGLIWGGNDGEYAQELKTSSELALRGGAVSGAAAGARPGASDRAVTPFKDAWHELYNGQGEEEQHCSWTYWSQRVSMAKGNNEGLRLDYCVVCNLPPTWCTFSSLISCVRVISFHSTTNGLDSIPVFGSHSLTFSIHYFTVSLPTRSFRTAQCAIFETSTRYISTTCRH
jgi:exonuclease III